MKKNLAQRRIKRKWTQADLAAALGVSRQTVISIERERYDPSLLLALLIARLLGSAIEDVLSVEGERATSPDEHVV